MIPDPPAFAQFEPGMRGLRVEALVRPAETTDLPRLAELQRRAARPAHLDAYERALCDPERLVVVAEADDGVIAWAQTYLHRTVDDPAPAGHYLGGVTVDPGWRRRGLAAQLTQVRLDWIAERAEWAYYVVNPANRASIELHRPWGFVEVLRAPVLTGVQFSGGIGLLMRARLPVVDGPSDEPGQFAPVPCGSRPLQWGPAA